MNRTFFVIYSNSLRILVFAHRLQINKLREAVSKYKSPDQQLSIAHAPGPVEPVRDWNDLLNVPSPAAAAFKSS
jgi:hypothetical protein